MTVQTPASTRRAPRLAAKITLLTGVVAGVAAFLANVDSITRIACERTPITCKPKELSLIPGTANLAVGETLQLVVKGGSDRYLIRYVTADSQIAVVDSTGKVSAYKPGTVVVRVQLISDPTIDASSTITVSAAPPAAAPTPDANAVDVGDQAPRQAFSTTADQTLWRQNWAVINEPVPHYGSSTGVRATNRERLQSVLRALDLRSDVELQRQLTDLIHLVEAAAANDDPFYNMQMSDAIDLAFRELRRGIQKAAIAKGVEIE